MVSFAERHLAVMDLEVTLLDADAPVVVSAQILNRQDGFDEYHMTSTAMGAGFDPRAAPTCPDASSSPSCTTRRATGSCSVIG
jgi:alpha,alpha-trehalose phosphorylase